MGARNVGILLLIASCAVSVGCKTVPIEERTPIRVPTGLDDDSIELAIVIAVINPPPEAINFNYKAAEITQEILTAIFGQSRRRVDWFVESRNPGVVYAGRQKGRHYLSVALHYDLDSVRIEILRSEELSQTSTRIHKTAYAWIQTLEQRLRVALSDLASAMP